MNEAPSYIDYEAFLAPEFQAVPFANNLVLSTNNASDTPLDLSTPLSRVLFDVQEIDTHIERLTTASAIPLLTHTLSNADVSARVLANVESHVARLNDGHDRLNSEISQRWRTANEVCQVAKSLCAAVQICRSTARCLTLCRQLEVQIAEIGTSKPATAMRREDHRSMVRASGTLLSLQHFLSTSELGQQSHDFGRVVAFQSLQAGLIRPSETLLRSRAQQIIREFSLSTLGHPIASSTSSVGSNAMVPSTYAQITETKARTTSALQSLCLLSSPLADAAVGGVAVHDLATAALAAYLQTSLTSSVAAISRALTALPSLDRTLAEVAARCQNIVALESLLGNTRPPHHPLLGKAYASELESETRSAASVTTLLQPLLVALDTASLPSHFWRSLASALSARVHEIVAKGGTQARMLRAGRERLRDGVRACVIQGFQGVEDTGRGWDREIAVMVGAVTGHLGTDG
ncbi:MAG: hypothetical protein M1825_005408 [Sarcosagium campestre]|nr:MAG: hypothetical protein M1825_005408 [Sarcosagium campestre]